MFEKFVKETTKMTALVNGISLLKLPLLAFITPQVVTLTDQKSEVKVRLGWRTRNHLNVMYFGALAMGAELSIALKAVQEIQKSGMRIDFLFQDFEAQFLKRAEGHAHCVCLEAAKVTAMIEKAKTSPDRISEKLSGYAYVPSISEEPVMTYKLTLSVKGRHKKV